MLLMRLFLVFLASSAILKITASIPLLVTTQPHLIPETKAAEPSPEAKRFEPNTLIHGVPDDVFFSPAPSDMPPTEPEDRKKFGLWASGHTMPEKTVLLNNGEAKFDATFTLVLREGEDLKGMRQRPNDTSIITSFEEFRERHVGRVVSYNITITHHFMGTVGTAKYELTVFTTMGASLHVTGIYYVSGVVVYASTDGKPLRIVSGRNASPLSVESMHSFSSVMKNGHIMLPLKFQKVGPDVSGKPASFADILSTAKITVASMPSEDMPVLINNAPNCNENHKMLSIRQNARREWENCDVGFDYDSMSLVLRLHPDRYGNAIIGIAFISIGTDTESFKTEIRLKIAKPAVKRPELIMKNNVHLQLDYYGTESFFLQLKDMKTSDHSRKVLSYVVDLPGNRYATADFTSSSLDGPIQNISFTVVSPKQENAMLQKKIRHALMVLVDSHRRDRNEQPAIAALRRLKHRANESDALPGHREYPKTGISSFNLPSFVLYDGNEYSGDFDVVSVSRSQEGTHKYTSHVHAVFPNFDDLITVETPSASVLWTSFASKKLAVVEALRVRTDYQNVLVKLTLLRYTLSTLSEHKAMQISKSLSKEVSMFLRVSLQPASLVKLEDRGLNVEASYHILVPQNYTDAAMDLNKHKKNISSTTANSAFLKDGRLMLSEVVRLEVSGRPTYVNLTSSAEPPRYKGLSGTLVAIIIVAAVLIAIPLLTACVGYLAARRYREEEASSSEGNSGQAATQAKTRVMKSRDDSQAATDVLRDNYGRAEYESYESFRVRTEMTNQGYFGDKDSSGKEKSTSPGNS